MKIKELNRDDFKSHVEDSEKPVLVDFWAPWCGPCRMIAPELEAAATHIGDRAVVAKVNVDDEPELAEAFGIQSIPSLILFRNGRPVKRLNGYHDRSDLVQVLS